MGRTKWSIIVGLILFMLISQSGTIMVSFSFTSKTMYSNPDQSEQIWTLVNDDFVNANVAPDDIVFANATHGWVLSQTEDSLFNGIVLNTRDGGNNWASSLQNESDRYRKIAIIDSDTIWVTCRTGLYYTNDSGTTWDLTTLGKFNESFSFYGVYFFNRTLGWVSSNTRMYRTIDSGKTWQMLNSVASDDWARMIRFLTPQEGWAIGFFGIYHTTDGGENWTKSYNKGGWSLSFISTTEAWAVGDEWVATMNNGKTWVTQPSPRDSPFPPPIAPYYSDIFFLDSMHGWLAGWETEIAYTPNGGRDWYSQSFYGDTRVKSVFFINATHGWAVGTGGYIYQTTRGNSLGTRLWMGLSDPIIIGAISVPIILTVSIIGLLRVRKKRHSHQRSTAGTIDVI